MAPFLASPTGLTVSLPPVLTQFAMSRLQCHIVDKLWLLIRWMFRITKVLKEGDLGLVCEVIVVIAWSDVTWLQSGHWDAHLMIAVSWWHIATCSPFATFYTIFSQAKSMGKIAEKIQVVSDASPSENPSRRSPDLILFPSHLWSIAPPFHTFPREDMRKGTSPAGLLKIKWSCQRTCKRIKNGEHVLRMKSKTYAQEKTDPGGDRQIWENVGNLSSDSPNPFESCSLIRFPGLFHFPLVACLLLSGLWGWIIPNCPLLRISLEEMMQQRPNNCHILPWWLFALSNAHEFAIFWVNSACETL